MKCAAWGFAGLGFIACGGAIVAPEPQRAVGTGDPLPAHAHEPAVCKPDGGFRWLGLDPHVPLAVVDGKRFDPAAECCAAWARAGDRWTAVDARGAPLGDLTVRGGEGYDVTQCYELDLGEVPAGAVAFVRGERPWRAPTAIAWEPTVEERAGLLELVGALDHALTPPAMGTEPRPELRPADERVTFFAMPANQGDPRAATRFAAIGGRSLAIAGLDTEGKWRVLHLDTSWSPASWWVPEPYRVLGAFDMDGDGYPEVMVHRTEGASWDDVVLGCEHDSSMREWEIKVTSVGGSTA